MPHVTVALTAQYLIQTASVHILQHESAVTDSLPEEEFMHGHWAFLPLPNDLARQ